MRAINASVFRPTTSRPRRTQAHRVNSRRRWAVSPMAFPLPAIEPGGSMTTRRASARRASAVRRSIRVATAARPDARPTGRSRTSRSTVRDAKRSPAIARPSSRFSGTSTASQSVRTPRLTASTGSKLRETSIQATIAPPTWASAARRRASVVTPAEPAPARATLPLRGTPADPRIASRAAKPVRKAGSRPASRSGWSGILRSSERGCTASEPTTSGLVRGAASPHRTRSVESAAARSPGAVAMGRI